MRLVHTSLSRQEALDFELLTLIDGNPDLSQRQIADELGISLGRTNYSMRALIARRAVELSACPSTHGAPRHSYVLTFEGRSERAAMASRVLEQKIAEYERLHAQIVALRRIDVEI